MTCSDGRCWSDRPAACGEPSWRFGGPRSQARAPCPRREPQPRTSSAPCDRARASSTRPRKPPDQVGGGRAGRRSGCQRGKSCGATDGAGGPTARRRLVPVPRRSEARQRGLVAAAMGRVGEVARHDLPAVLVANVPTNELLVGQVDPAHAPRLLWTGCVHGTLSFRVAAAPVSASALPSPVYPTCSHGEASWIGSLVTNVLVRLRAATKPRMGQLCIGANKSGQSQSRSTGLG